MKESSIEQRTCQWADAKDIDHIKLNILGRRGYPDRLFFIHGGRPLLLEFKQLGKKPRKLQQYRIDKLKKLGYDVASVDNYEEATEHIQNAIDREHDKEVFAHAIASEFQIPKRLISLAGDSRLASAPVSKSRRAVSAQAVQRRSVPRSRAGQNKHHAQGD